MEPQHPGRGEEYHAEPAAGSPSRTTRALPARTAHRRRDGDDVGGTLQVIEHNPDDFEDDSDGSDEDVSNKRRRGRTGKPYGRRSIKISYIVDKSRRNITFNKRKTGILKKAHELSVLTGADVLLLIASRDTEQVYTFSTPNMYPLTNDAVGRQNIQNCLRFGSINAPPGAAPATAPIGVSSSRPPQQQQSPTSPESRDAYQQAPAGPGGSSASARSALSLAMPAPGFSPQQQYQQPYQSPSPDRGGVRYGSAAPSHHASTSGQQGLTAGQMAALQQGAAGAAAGAPEGSPTPGGWEQGHNHPAGIPHPQQQYASPAQALPAHQNRPLTRSFMPSPGFGPFANYPNAAHLQHQHSAAEERPGTAGTGPQSSAAVGTPSGLTGPASAGATDWIAGGGQGRGSVSARQPSVTVVHPARSEGQPSAGRSVAAGPQGGSHPDSHATYMAAYHGRRGSDVNTAGQSYTASDEGPIYGGQLSSGGSDDGLEGDLNGPQYFKQEPVDDPPYGALG